jgi:SAM-dependent methyltransferase
MLAGAQMRLCRWIDAVRRRLGLLPRAPHPRRVRTSAAARYLCGRGIEIGALLQPLPVPRRARVRYVDRLPVEELRKHYPQFDARRLVRVDHIDDGERLDTFADGSQDFVIANHVIEHMEDPLGAVCNWLRVLRPGGVLYCALPDKRHTFDRDRPETSLDHMIRDHGESPRWSRTAHYREFVRNVERFPDAEVCERAAAMEAMGYSVHFHVWTPQSFVRFLLHVADTTPLRFDIELVQANGAETIFILRRTPGQAAAGAP